MAQEIKQLPKIAQTAFAQLNASVQQQVGILAEQAAEALGIDAKDGWKFDAQQMVFTREVADVTQDLTLVKE